MSAVGHRSGRVLAHAPISADGDQVAAERTVAPALLERIDGHDRVLTGDALVCQRALCPPVCAAGGESLVRGKTNQPARPDASAVLFDPPADRAADRDWPGLAQVGRVERTWRAHGKDHRARHDLIPTLTPDHADPARRLAGRRGHWASDHHRHRQQAVAVGEDARVVHLGQRPTVLARWRDAALTLLHHAGMRKIAAPRRRHAQHPEPAVALVVSGRPPHA